MPKVVRLTARVALPYDGRQIAAGETFEARPVDAVILLRKKQAIFAKRPEPVATPIQQKDQVAEEPSPEPARRRRQYRRRDLVAEA